MLAIKLPNFPADCPHRRIVTSNSPVSSDTRDFPAYSQIYRQQRSNFTVSRRSEPSSRTTLTGEQPDPWDLLQPQDVMSRHRGAKLPRRCELLEEISLLSPEYLLSVERWRFHTPTTGSLKPTFVPARLVGLTVKLPFAFALSVRLPSALREPLYTSVTI